MENKIIGLKELPDKIKKKVNDWLKKPYDLKTQEEVKNLLNSKDSKSLYEAFYKTIEFGTSGLRGIMGVGTNRINKYTIGKIILGFAHYLKKLSEKDLKVVVGYDVRNQSKFFARIGAQILTNQGIKVYLFDHFCATPVLSFAIRELRADAGIMITASHNPAKYNGLKIYLEGGGQVTSPYEEIIMEEIKKISFEEVSFEKKNSSLISFLTNQINEKFIQTSIKHTSFDLEKKKKQDLKILFTPLHGTAINIVPAAFAASGFSGFEILKEQASPDGNFPTVVSPNPEEKSSFAFALKYAKNNPVDLILASDPDADRLGVGVNYKDEIQLLNGNQTNTLLSFFLLEKQKKQGLLNSTDFIATTAVSSEIFTQMASYSGVQCKVSLTGFKWIAQMVDKAEPSERFIGGGEESFGFMVGDFIRDKDAISSMLLMAELESQLKEKGSSLYEKLLEIYMQLGFYYDYSFSKIYEGEQGVFKIKEIMKKYRENSPSWFGNFQVIQIDDYLLKKSIDLANNKKNELNFPPTNLLIYRLKGGGKVALRPSGTEPKIKFYFNLKTQLKNKSNYTSLLKEMKKETTQIIKSLNF